MPKGMKNSESPIQKKIREICAEFFLVPAPKLIETIEEALLANLNAELVMKAHRQIIQLPVTGGKKPAPPASASQAPQGGPSNPDA
jgi:hypothetical protein